MNPLSEQVARLNDVLCAVNALNWDARTQMPAGGAITRGQQIATLMGLARNMIIDPVMQAAVDEAGDATAAQLMAHLDEQSPRIRHALNAADTAPLNLALEQKVWRWGRRKTRAGILEASGLKANDALPYLAYLQNKFR